MAPPDILWVDSDILLDWLAKRAPWEEAATGLIKCAARSQCPLWLSPLTLANLFYVLRKQAGTAAALNAVRVLTDIVQIAGMDGSHVLTALKENRPDFEDELQIAAARSAGFLTAIITRNLSDYRHAGLKVMTAGDWLKQHNRNLQP